MRLGSHYQNRVDDRLREERLVEKVLTYASGWDILVHDIAILKLKEPVIFCAFIARCMDLPFSLFT